jgi:hypothetical protein
VEEPGRLHFQGESDHCLEAGAVCQRAQWYKLQSSRQQTNKDTHLSCIFYRNSAVQKLYFYEKFEEHTQDIVCYASREPTQLNRNFISIAFYISK